MRKALLVTMIGMALAIELYGVINNFMINKVEEVDHIAETTTIVYVE